MVWTEPHCMGIIWCRCEFKKLPVAAEYEKQAVYVSDRNR